jgi:protein O-GlcNAc transferase
MSYTRNTQHTHAVAEQIRKAMSLQTTGRIDEAEALYRHVLRQHPDQFDATHLLGVIAMQRGQWALAIERLSKAASLQPRHAQAQANLGTALLRADRSDEGLKCYEHALELDPNFTGALNNYGNALQALGRHEEAAIALGRLKEHTPGFDYAAGAAFQSLRHSAQWEGYATRTSNLIDAVSSRKRADRPFSFLSVSGSAAHQLECARTYMNHLYPLHPSALWNGERYKHDKTRIAYLSADFKAHVVANHTSALYERHDPRHFHTIGISLTATDDSDVVQRAKRSLAEFHDGSHISDEAAAQLIRNEEIDVLVDLTGYTLGCRTGILARRPAPVQINFLGFPGTLGAPYIDYIIADDFVIPPSAAHLYAEQIVRMPHSFQTNDDRRTRVSNTTRPSRAAEGLPEDAFVFSTFNNTYKINPACFDSWSRILNQTPHSVLWMLGETPAIRERLIQQATARGVDSDRLVFATRLPYEEHLARLSLADLFLDSLPFNAGATASDSLWAGVPLLTCAGDAFAARMGGSLLNALGLPQLITTNQGDYEQRAIELANNAAQLSDIRNQLAANRDTHPLFNSEVYCRHLETAYRQMWSRTQAGKPPESFTVAAAG